MHRLSSYTVFLLGISFLLLCGTFSYGTVNICTTTSLVADLLRSVGGEDVCVTTLMGPGVDPHLYQATLADCHKLSRADAIFYNGLYLEGNLTWTLQNIKKRGKSVHAVSADIPKEKLIAIEKTKDIYDPHVWFDPRLWALCVDTVRSALTEKDPAHAAGYKARAHALIKQYNTLYDRGIALAEKLPPGKRILITSHDAYSYFGKAFGFQVFGIQGISTVSETGLADIVKAVDFIKTHKVKAIFVETSVPWTTIARISRDSGASIGGELFSDALGPPGDVRENSHDVGTYAGMLEYNINTIVNALK